ncbi:phosphopantothenoylcysteine decarboxylase/phosphopantothenate--cysteine ligase [Methylomicrobium album BG8]|uniref:Coenzyme A biosynthesis bifunctional protein CoaBC n=2 Tax=Methylococcaceae TaxID=403 RepID=H8GGN4_METAL|nr:phosphopantothenoylcysteine decarboxylase/phosphopantothenate--cysteine ligase [Methylomicrobium album BG8]
MRLFSTLCGMSEAKRILLGVSGGIAVYKAAELVRLLRKEGAEVRVAMTRAASRFVTPLTFQALSGNPVHTELLDAESENAMDHISLARWADLIVIAPATANLIAKLSHGLADDLLTTLYLAATCPVYVAPAMNQAMWGKSATRENVAALQRHGVRLIGPVQGEQACGETGFGRMSEPQAICAALLGEPAERPLQGMKVLISAGPTREPLDPVRYLTNRSSGKMGYALAEAARDMGASVILVSGPTQLPPPAQVDLVRVETAAEMYEAVIARAEASDIYIGAAAVADYTPAETQSEKIKKRGDTATLVLRKTRDILAEVAALEKRPFTVGFAAETVDLEAYALDKLARKNLDMIAANWVGQAEGGFDSDRNALEVFWKGGREALAMTGKKRLADRLTALIAERLQAGVVVR